MRPSKAQLFFVGVLVLGPCATPVGAAQQLAYGMDRTSTLYQFDPSTGAATAIGPVGIAKATGAAIDPATGTLYVGPGGDGSQVQPTTGCLYTVSTATGAATLVGCDANQGGKDPVKFAVSPAGVLYGARLAPLPAEPKMILCRVNTSTGALTDIGPITPNAWCTGYGMEFGGDGQLYSHDDCIGLTRLDTSTGSPTVIGGSLVGFPTSNAFTIPDMGRDRDGVLWAIVVGHSPGSPNTYYTGTVNTSTGDVTYVATLPETIQTIDFKDAGGFPVPALGEPGLILLGAVIALAALCLLRGRRLHAV